jgi:hypothetical protein
MGPVSACRNRHRRALSGVATTENDWKIVHVEIDIGENGEKTMQMTGN